MQIHVICQITIRRGIWKIYLIGSCSFVTARKALQRLSGAPLSPLSCLAIFKHCTNACRSACSIITKTIHHLSIGLSPDEFFICIIKSTSYSHCLKAYQALGVSTAPAPRRENAFLCTFPKWSLLPIAIVAPIGTPPLWSSTTITRSPSPWSSDIPVLLIVARIIVSSVSATTRSPSLLHFEN